MNENRGYLWLLAGVMGGVLLFGLCLAVIVLFFVPVGVRQTVGPALPPSPTAASAPVTAIPPTQPAHSTALPTFTPVPGASPQPTLLPETATATSTVNADPSSEPQGRIVFTCFNEGFDDICTINADGTDEQRLTTARATDFYPEWGPSGEWIVFSSRRGGSFEIYLLNASGGLPQQVSPGRGSRFAPDISPDGQRIVFADAVQSEPGRLRQHIWVMDIDGSNLRQLTSGPYNDIDPVWSPDGTQIAFASDRGWKPAHWIMNADGSDMRMLPDDVREHGGRSDWSPDGRWLAFYAGPRDNRDIYMVATDGSGESRRLTYGGRNLAPSFSPDGNWIVFTSYREGNDAESDAELFLMRTDGSDVRQLTFNDRPDWQPRWAPGP